MLRPKPITEGISWVAPPRSLTADERAMLPRTLRGGLSSTGVFVVLALLAEWRFPSPEFTGRWPYLGLVGLGFTLIFVGFNWLFLRQFRQPRRCTVDSKGVRVEYRSGEGQRFPWSTLAAYTSAGETVRLVRPPPSYQDWRRAAKLAYAEPLPLPPDDVANRIVHELLERHLPRVDPALIEEGDGGLRVSGRAVFETLPWAAVSAWLFLGGHLTSVTWAVGMVLASILGPCTLRAGINGDLIRLGRERRLGALVASNLGAAAAWMAGSMIGGSILIWRHLP
ncbi:MAG: hypothetical protein H6700_00050 [Myxococcales bacterium]|nr:hypothetical protein [Myxococcales bacterium]